MFLAIDLHSLTAALPFVKVCTSLFLFVSEDSYFCGIHRLFSPFNQSINIPDLAQKKESRQNQAWDTPDPCTMTTKRALHCLRLRPLSSRNPSLLLRESVSQSTTYVAPVRSLPPLLVQSVM